MRNTANNDPVKSTAITASEPRRRDDEPWIEPLAGWRLFAAWVLVIVGPWVFLYGLGRIVYDLVIAWPDVVEMLTW